jgi:hypothetical protein
MPQKPNPLAKSSARPPFVVVPELLTGEEAAHYTGMNYYASLMRTGSSWRG